MKKLIVKNDKVIVVKNDDVLGRKVEVNAKKTYKTDFGKGSVKNFSHISFSGGPGIVSGSSHFLFQLQFS